MFVSLFIYLSPGFTPGSHANQSPRILNSLQTFMIRRSIVITLVRSRGPSEQCRQDLIVLPLLKLGLITRTRMIRPIYDELPTSYCSVPAWGR
jgi:hypothetical protein